MNGSAQAAGGQRQCKVCGREYKRSSHLRRHEATHTSSDQHICPFCSKAFARRDVCRKHVSSCPQRTTSEDPPPARRGQRPRACDSCFKSKVLCDNAAPCSRCTSREKRCTYSRASEELGPAPLSSSTTTKDTGGPAPARFLLGLTDPKAETMVDVILKEFSDRENDSDHAEPTPATTSSSLLDRFPIDYGLIYWGFNQYEPGEFSETLADAFMDHGIQFDPACSEGPSSTDQPLTVAITSILNELDGFYASLEASNRLPSGDYYFDLATAHRVLTPANMQTHLAAYFRFTNTYYPIVHRPTFNIATASPALVLSLFLCGTLYRGDKNEDYSGVYNIAEEYAFTQLGLAMERHAAGTIGATKDVAVTVQAAAMVHSLQWVISCASSRRRNRDVRLPALVNAVRTLRYTRLRHSEQNSEGPLDWERFIELETCIRTGTVVMSLDWHQGGMYHSPYHTTIYELTGDLPCPKSLWEASDASEFRSIIQSEGVNEILHRPYSLRSCVEDLMRDDFSVSHLVSLRKLGFADLCIIVPALHVIIASARFSCTLPVLAPKIMRATCRWEDLWKGAVSKVGEREIEAGGFAKHSLEMCWMARKNIEMSVSGKETAAYFRNVTHEGLEELHALLKELQCTG